MGDRFDGNFLSLVVFRSCRGHGSRLSGSGSVLSEGELSWIENRPRWRLVQAIEPPAVHEVGAHQSGQGVRADNGLLPGLDQAHQQEGDPGDRDLNGHGVFPGAEKYG